MRLSVAVLLVVLWVGAAAHAVSERGFAETLRGEVWPHYEAGTFGSFVGADGVRIVYAKFAVSAERDALVILPGKSESFIKYAELVYDLRRCGYSLYLMDHRGMGFSDGLLPGDKDKVHVECFDDYVSDLRTFVEQVVDATPHDRRIVLGHSMGATVALRFLQVHPEVFAGAILCAPMLQVNTDPFPGPLAYRLCAVARLAGLGDAYCPGRGPWEPGTFAENTFTHSAPRWSLWECTLIPAFPVCGIGGVTMRWLHESMRAGAHIRKRAEDVQVPVLMFQAGQDALVGTPGQDEACRRMGDCRLVVFPDARHEILMERDEIRERALMEIRMFLAGMDSTARAAPRAERLR